MEMVRESNLMQLAWLMSVSCRQQKHPDSSLPPPCHWGEVDAGETALSTIEAPDTAPLRMHVLVCMHACWSNASWYSAFSRSHRCPLRGTGVGAVMPLVSVAVIRCWLLHSLIVAYMKGALHEKYCKCEMRSQAESVQQLQAQIMLFDGQKIIGWDSKHVFYNGDWPFYVFLPLLVTPQVVSWMSLLNLQKCQQTDLKWMTSYNLVLVGLISSDENCNSKSGK